MGNCCMSLESKKRAKGLQNFRNTRASIVKKTSIIDKMENKRSIQLVKNIVETKLEITASKKQAMKLYKSFGALRPMLAFLNQFEQIRLQLANQFFYDIAVSRVQTIIQLESSLFIFYNVLQNTASVFDLRKGKIERNFSLQGILRSISSTVFIQVKNVVYVYIHYLRVKNSWFELSGFDCIWNRIKKEQKASINLQVDARAFVSFQNSHIVASGGKNQSGESSKAVEIYHIKENKWIMAPSMNLARYSHTSCILGNYVYIASVSARNMQDSVERFDMQSYLKNAGSISWQLIIARGYDSFRPPKTVSLMAPLNDSEIIILDSFKKDQQQNTALVFNTSKMSFKEVDQPFTFLVRNNRSMLAGKDKIVAYVDEIK